jgi:3-deoxy-D-manno-octulosonate 8-phosphate phosphatase KdsC-like HAD superfamily phosphatase
MSKWLVERKLSEAAERLRQLRAELAVVDEQLAFLADAADDARMRAMVSETPMADKEHREAQKHADAMTRHRGQLVAQIAELEKAQDELLERLFAEI